MAEAQIMRESQIKRRPVESLDPATGEKWAEFEPTSEEHVEVAIQSARKAQLNWHNLGLNPRLAILRRLKESLYAHRRDVASLITRECGKPVAEALSAEIMTSLDLMEFYLNRAPKLLKVKKWRHKNIAFKFKRAVLMPQPWGVVGVITPWNYPLMLPIGAVFPALVAGNSVVLKPAEYTTSVAMRLAQLAHEAGVPENAFQVIPGDGLTGAALIPKGVDRMIFIGSERAGRMVAKAASERLIPVTLELGGSDPMLVLRDAPLKTAAAAAIWGRFMNCGQTCVAVKRVFVEEPIYHEFVERVLQGVKKLRPGPGTDPNSDLGPMIRETQVAILERQLHDAVDRGAQIRCGGRRRPDIGPLFFEPTVLTEVTPDMAVMKEETFGPILPLIPVKNIEEAVKMANASSYGLSASIWTKNSALAYQLAQQLQSGAVTVNDASFHPGVCDVPYGGFKNSGLGKSHGEAGLLDMVKEQYIDMDPLAAQYKPWWFGYSQSMLNQMDRFITFIHGKSFTERIVSIPGAIMLLWHRHKI